MRLLIETRRTGVFPNHSQGTVDFAVIAYEGQSSSASRATRRGGVITEDSISVDFGRAFIPICQDRWKRRSGESVVRMLLIHNSVADRNAWRTSKSWLAASQAFTAMPSLQT